MQWINCRKLVEKVKSCNLLNNYRFSTNSNAFVYGHDVAMAKKNGLPIVALESTIITHGMPYSDNLKTAIKVENAVRTKVTVIELYSQIHLQISISVYIFEW